MHLTKDATFQWVEKLRDVYLDFSSLDDFNRYDEILQNITPSDIRIISKSIFDINSYGVFLLSDK
jgi:zinc protease